MIRWIGFPEVTSQPLKCNKLWTSLENLLPIEIRMILKF